MKFSHKTYQKKLQKLVDAILDIHPEVEHLFGEGHKYDITLICPPGEKKCPFREKLK